GSDSDGGITYSPSVHYHYAVDDHPYDGHEWRHGTKTSNRIIANEGVTAYRAGSDATGYYDPRPPQRAVLMPGLTGSDLFIFVFLIPFNVIALGSWCAGFGFLRSRISPIPAGGVRIIMDGRRTRVRLPEKDPAWWASGIAALLAFAA